MKETYFTTESIERKATELLRRTQHLSRGSIDNLRPRRSALLIMDMQKYFLEPDSHAFIPSAGAILPGLTELLREYHQRSLPVFLTRHTNNTTNAGRMADWWQELIRPDDPLSKLDNELAAAGGIIIEKNQYNAFHGTRLEEMLRARQVTQIVIGGLMTHLCCETTARSAFCRGFEVFFTVDGTATYNEQFHQASLQNLAHGFATMVTVPQLLAVLRNHAD